MNAIRSKALVTMLALVLLTACGVGTDEAASDSDGELYQIGTLAALSAGGYDGLITLDEMLENGDFGLGTFDALDGEMIVLDGTVYQVPASGVASEPDGDLTTPFAAVTTWDADATHEFPDPLSCADLQTAIDGLIDTSAPYAVKVEGQFATLVTRSEERQTPPYAPLEEVLQGQIEFQLDDVTATMSGFRLPDFMANANAAGYHFHAITEDRQAGGHVLDCQTSNVSVEVDAIDSWQVDLVQAD
jgi:acetolactate decarboxylase